MCCGNWMQVFINDAGDVVISFNAAAACQEGNVGSYMSHMVKQSEVVTEFRCITAVMAVRSCWMVCLLRVSTMRARSFAP